MTAPFFSKSPASSKGHRSFRSVGGHENAKKKVKGVTKTSQKMGKITSWVFPLLFVACRAAEVEVNSQGFVANVSELNYALFRTKLRRQYVHTKSTACCHY
jgi:hypothetical protein